MQANASSVPRRHPSRVVRRRLWAQKVSVPEEQLPQALGFILRWLREHEGRHAAWVARRCGRSAQMVRDLEVGRYDHFAWLNAYVVCRALRTSLAHVEKLMQRFVTHDYLRQKRLHGDQPGWWYDWPWSKNRARPDVRRRQR